MRTDESICRKNKAKSVYISDKLNGNEMPRRVVKKQ